MISWQSILTQLIQPLFTVITPAEEEVHINSISGQEDLSDLIGTALPMYYQLMTTNENPLWKSVLVHFSRCNHPFYEKYITEYNAESIQFRDMLFLTALHDSISRGLYHRLAQITDYDLITEDQIVIFHQRLAQHLNLDCKYEQSMYLEHETEYGTIHLHGRLDVVNPTHIFEIKCKTNFKLEDMLQLILYYWLYEKLHPSPVQQFCLLSIKTNELVQLHPNLELIDRVVQSLFRNKFFEQSVDQFDVEVGRIKNK